MDFSHWKEYYESNRTHFDDIMWNQPDTLTPEEKKLITKSLQQFQKGENSEGKHLYSFAKAFVDSTYRECIKLFIKEEQKHAAVLGRYMDRNEIDRIKKHWVDNVFRWLRKLAGLENTVLVLLTAEIISKVYYKGLKQATGSVLLQQLCAQVLKDEDRHIDFQVYTLQGLYRQKSRLRRWFNRSWHFILMNGTIVVVWWHHAPVLKAGGFSFFRFLLESLLVYAEADKQIKERNQLQLVPV